MRNLLLAMLLVITCAGLVPAQVPAADSVRTVPDFALTDVQGQVRSLSAWEGARGFIVIFTCNHCPFAKLYPERLNALHAKYAPLGIPVIAINSMDTLVYAEETLAGMQAFSQQHGFQFPYLYDPSQAVGRSFGASFTPQAFVIWRNGDRWEVRYDGAIDDNGKHPEKAHSFIADAIADLQAGRTVRTAHTGAFGCRIYYRPEAGTAAAE